VPCRGIQRGVSDSGDGSREEEADATGWSRNEAGHESSSDEEVGLPLDRGLDRLLPSNSGTPNERPDLTSKASMFWV
jgi:hypothetical protein